ncbi:hypothetical protein Tco_0348303 [Tanacetum coccineum]
MFMHCFRGRSLLLLVIVNTASLHFLLLEFIICIELHGEGDDSTSSTSASFGFIMNTYYALVIDLSSPHKLVKILTAHPTPPTTTSFDMQMGCSAMAMAQTLKKMAMTEQTKEKGDLLTYKM